MNSFKPMLLTSLKSYDRAQFAKDVTAGIIVAIIALPLSIALALASGVGPEAGIFTAIVAGFVISALGGSCVQIAGPTAAFATIVAGIVARDGLEGLMTATILAGVFLIIMGFCHFGSLIKFIPYTITTGFTSGIAVTIVIGQLKDFCGITYPDGVKPIETMEKLKAFAENFSTISPDALIVGGAGRRNNACRSFDCPAPRPVRCHPPSGILHGGRIGQYYPALLKSTECGGGPAGSA